MCLKFKLLLLISFLLVSCDEDLRVDTSAKGDLNLFFEYLENDYAYRYAHPFTMSELKNRYMPEIESENTQKNLATLLVRIENELKDPHLYFKENEVYNLSNTKKYYNNLLETQLPKFSEITNLHHTPYYTYGLVKAQPHIGYLYIRAFNDAVGGTNSLEIEPGVKEIDAILQQMKEKSVRALIVDIRSYAGGSNYVPRYIAQRFSNKPACYMVEYYPVGSSFVRKKWCLQPQAEGFKEAKIALLSNGVTASGGEMFVLAMLQRDNLIHIGSNSAGAAGNIVDKDLSNGWNFTMTNSRTEFPDGRQYYKVGIKPSIIVKNDSEYGYTHWNDKLIETATFELLK